MGAEVFSLRPPGEVRILASFQAGGAADYVDLLRAFGISLALRASGNDTAQPLEERRLLGMPEADAHGLAFSQFLTLEGWHRRYLGASRPVAKDAIKLVALFHLASLRRAIVERLSLRKRLRRQV